MLTKRHDELVRYSRRRKLPPNFWAGVTAEDQHWLNIRAAALLEVRAQIRFLSLEPALDYMRIERFVERRDNKVGGDGIQWVIYGGESGSHLTRPKQARARALVEPGPGGNGWLPRWDRIPWALGVQRECEENGVPFFFKQWGGPRTSSGGNLLDARTHESYPRLPGTAIPDHSHRERIRKGLGGATAGSQLRLEVL